MKKRNIGICIITTTLLMGGHAKATELILAKDHTNVVSRNLPLLISWDTSKEKVHL